MDSHCLHEIYNSHVVNFEEKHISALLKHEITQSNILWETANMNMYFKCADLMIVSKYK